MPNSFRPIVYNGANYQPDTTERDERRKFYGRKWNRYSWWYRSQHPFCARCGEPAFGTAEDEEGRNASLGVVDHITPHKGDARLFWDRNNHQTLCIQCHNAKSATEK